ncbi:MAG TPA: sigma-70 family RNA polymerase sigma factor [Candidatus Saccharimonadales bacterium]|nr:sigma-70 family RNA polymerase sigma factor [Candidatus Saccharimonadales bacterium]
MAPVPVKPAMNQGHTYRTHEEVVEGIRGGDPAAVDVLFESYADLVHGYAAKLLGSVEAARKLLPGVFVSALPQVLEARTEQAVERVLLREASQQYLASRDSSGESEPPIDELFPDSAGGRGGSAHDWSLDPDEEERRPEEKRLLREIVVSMPPQYALVLVLFDMEEMSEQDVADIVRISVPAVKTRLHRARLYARRELTRRLSSTGKNGGDGTS